MRTRARDSDRLRLRDQLARLEAREWRTLVMMAVVVVGLHVAGFSILVAVVAPRPLPPRHGGDVHGRDRDHGLHARVAPCIRRRSHRRDRQHDPQADVGGQAAAVGRVLVLAGTSSVVFALAFLISVGVRSLDGPLKRGGSQLHAVTTTVGTGVSGGFLYLIAAINVAILISIVKVFREMRGGAYDEKALEAQLGEPRLDEPLLRTVHADDHQARADVPDRRALRPGVRHRDRGRSARRRRQRGRRGLAVVRHSVPADPVCRRDDA